MVNDPAIRRVSLTVTPFLLPLRRVEPSQLTARIKRRSDSLWRRTVAQVDRIKRAPACHLVYDGAVMVAAMPRSAIFYAKVFAAYSAVLGLICGIAYSFGGAIHDLTHGGANMGTWLAFLALAGMPIIATVLGFLLGFALAAPVRVILRRFA